VRLLVEFVLPAAIVLGGGWLVARWAAERGGGALRRRRAERALWRVEVEQLPAAETPEGTVGSRVAVVLRREGEVVTHRIAVLDPASDDFSYELEEAESRAQERAVALNQALRMLGR
jgi:hypothetical protein